MSHASKAFPVGTLVYLSDGTGEVVGHSGEQYVIVLVNGNRNIYHHLELTKKTESLP